MCNANLYPLPNPLHEVAEVIDGGDVVIVHFEFHVRVDLVQRVPGCLYLAQPGLLRLEEETVHVCHLHLVVVKQ